MNIFKKFNEGFKSEIICVTAHYKPAIGGTSGDIYKNKNGMVYALLQWVDGVTQYELIGMVPQKYADMAELLQYDPYNDAGYAHATINLAKAALSVADFHQYSGKMTAKSGPADLSDFNIC